MHYDASNILNSTTLQLLNYSFCEFNT